jgi:hypothetical protein
LKPALIVGVLDAPLVVAIDGDCISCVIAEGNDGALVIRANAKRPALSQESRRQMRGKVWGRSFCKPGKQYLLQ